MTTQRIADETIKAIATGRERGRHVIDSLASIAPQGNLGRRRRPDRTPVWIGAGPLAGGQSNRRLRDVMVADVHSVEPDATKAEAAEHMRQQNAGGHLAGMVTLSSLARRSQKPDETLAAARQVSLRSAREDAA